jgi:EAL domain-containing protein (putative c-di-GMP-specific phosphodiesterase class I)/GGDEF domain-containing protein
LGTALAQHCLSDASTAKREALAALGELHGVFQPIVSVAKGEIFAYEGLIRGPANLHLPAALFAAALGGGCSDELEYRASEVIIRKYAAAARSGRLFVNFSAQAVIHLGSDRGCEQLLRILEQCAMPARNLVIEVTEHERVVDHAGMVAAARMLRDIGVGIALDDFGDGGSSLRLWAEIEPEFVKIDRYFCHDIHNDGRKVQTVKAMLRLAENFGSRIVAEGIEQHADLRVVRDLGVDCVQGYALGHPLPEPAETVPGAVRAVLDAPDIAVFPQLRRAYNSSLTAARLLNPAPAVSKSMNNQQLLEIFQADADLPAVAVLSAGVPVGIVNRRRFLERFTLPYYPEVYGRKSCTTFMESNPLLIEVGQPLEELIHVLTAEDQRYLNDGFVLVDAGKYAGVGTAEQLVRSVTELRIEAARHANPLTFLPGNIPTSEHVRRLLLGGIHFCASYCDLNHFKAFNDRFGYWQGDKMIRLLAGVITQACDPQRDFAGHIGGDDFIVLLQSEDWESRCARMIEVFNAAAPALYDPLTRELGYIESEDRQGNPTRFPLTTLSIGALRVAPTQFDSPEDVATAAAAAKHQTKRSNAGLFVLDSSAAARDFERTYLRDSA